MVDLVRIDDRLVHGQVMAAWARALRTTHILVADDDSAADDFSRQIMQLAMPAHIALTVDTVDGAASRLPAIAADASHTLVLLKSVAAAERLHELWPFVHSTSAASAWRPAGGWCGAASPRRRKRWLRCNACARRAWTSTFK